ncbi:MAG: hypothetical protein FWH17_09010 [Oscillospiraceae bacterium]|nr:hypothetical protein [Oscillospiraceae bacterium]
MKIKKFGIFGFLACVISALILFGGIGAYVYAIYHETSYAYAAAAFEETAPDDLSLAGGGGCTSARGDFSSASADGAVVSADGGASSDYYMPLSSGTGSSIPAKISKSGMPAPPCTAANSNANPNTGVAASTAAAGTPPAADTDTACAGAFASDSFITGIYDEYSIVIEDPEGCLNKANGAAAGEEITRCLKAFSADFIRDLVLRYKQYGSSFIIRLEPLWDRNGGSARWTSDLVICLRFDENPSKSKATAGILAHELGHSVQFIINESYGRGSVEDGMTKLSRPYGYVGDSYNSEFKEELHGGVFACAYGMADVYEDIATIFELLVQDSEKMRSRLSNPENVPLRDKVLYIRDLTYQFVSDKCAALFCIS